MRERKPKLKSVIKEVARDPKRSPLFHWLAENYAELEPATAGPRSDWRPLRAKAIQHGITDDAGNSPSERTMRDTFRKVRQEVAKRQAELRQKAEPATPPSRMPATWRPTPIEPPPSRVASRPPSPTNTDSAPATPRELPEAARATLAALDRQLEWRDRYVNPPKRKD